MIRSYMHARLLPGSRARTPEEGSGSCVVLNFGSYGALMEPDHELAVDRHPAMNRRNMLRLLAGAGVVTLVSCSSSGRSASSGSSTTTATSPSSDRATPIPEETAGPFPGDGSNGPNVLSESGVVRRDITSSFGSAS